jgi:hypothetical protein
MPAVIIVAQWRELQVKKRVNLFSVLTVSNKSNMDCPDNEIGSDN